MLWFGQGLDAINLAQALNDLSACLGETLDEVHEVAAAVEQAMAQQFCHFSMRYMGHPAPERRIDNRVPTLGSCLWGPASAGAGAVKSAPQRAQRSRVRLVFFSSMIAKSHCRVRSRDSINWQVGPGNSGAGGRRWASGLGLTHRTGGNSIQPARCNGSIRLRHTIERKAPLA